MTGPIFVTIEPHQWSTVIRGITNRTRAIVWGRLAITWDAGRKQ